MKKCRKAGECHKGWQAERESGWLRTGQMGKIGVLGAGALADAKAAGYV